MSKNAFTLIEVLVVITIMGIIMGVGFAAYRLFARRQLVNNTISLIHNDLRLAQESAISGRKPDDAFCMGTNQLKGYNFLVDSVNGTYTISANCTGGVVEIKSFSIVTDLTLTAPVPNPIIFNVLGNGTNGDSQTKITVSDSVTGYAQSITISSTGELN
jgi:prepilin-type N-terminal cleavage/methylation domain-containing protein